jgi:hypothetical protein
MSAGCDVRHWTFRAEREKSLGAVSIQSKEDISAARHFPKDSTAALLGR